MNIIRELVKRSGNFIENIDMSLLISILEGQNEIKVLSKANGNLILNNKKIIKCISNYYLTQEGKNMKRMQETNFCYYNRLENNINCDNFKCERCHLICLEKLKNNELIIK